MCFYTLPAISLSTKASLSAICKHLTWINVVKIINCLLVNDSSGFLNCFLVRIVGYLNSSSLVERFESCSCKHSEATFICRQYSYACRVYTQTDVAGE